MAKPFLLMLALGATALAGCTAPGGTADFTQFHTVYDDQPFTGGQATPFHEWLVQGDELLFLHWNNEDPAQADGLLFTGDGFRGMGCIGAGGVSQQQIDAGFVHFHKESSPDWASGHHTTSDPTTVGWWLRHIQADPAADPMGVGASAVGDVYPLMPSYETAPACSDAATLYSDQPYSGGQDTPFHTWLVEGDTLKFLHWNNADPTKATGLFFVGDGFRGAGCIGPGGISQSQIDEGYHHFHKSVSPTWGEGHHTNDDPTTQGWWLRHIQVDPNADPMGIGASQPGEVYSLMPSFENAPDCVGLAL